MASRDGTPELITCPRAALRKALLFGWLEEQVLGVAWRGSRSEGAWAQHGARLGSRAGPAPLHRQGPTVKRKEQAVAQLGVREPRAALLPGTAPAGAQGLSRLLRERGIGC